MFERPSLGWVALVDYLRCGIRRYRSTFLDMMDNLIEPKLPLVKAPTLIVVGTRDYIVPRRAAERYAHLLPQGELEVVPGAAHGMNYSHPDLLAAVVRDFLTSATDQAAHEG